MKTPLIIGFRSKARQGKDSAAEAVVQYYEAKRSLERKHGFKASSPVAIRIGFADSLYQVAREEYGMTEKDAPLLQHIGHERREKFGKDYWINKALAKISPLHDIVVIPDCRYRNEAETIRSLGGYTVNIARLTKDGKPFVDPSRPANHPSEIDLDDWNWDFKFVIGDGHAALTGELAITLTEYLIGLRKQAQ